MARPLIPFVQNGYYASRNWIPLVKGNGFTTSGGGEQEEVWETASGSIVTFDAVAAPLRQLSVSVEPVQNLNGYDNPWPAGGGANIMDDAYSASYTNEIVLTEGTYYAQAWLTQNPSQHTTNPALLLDGAWTNITPPYSGDGISIAGTSFGWLYNNATQTITVDAGKTFTIRYNRNDAAMQTRRLTFSKTQLSAYAPYSNICPISGWDSVTVNRTGKNLFNPTSTNTDWFGIDGSISQVPSAKTNYIPVAAGQTLTISNANASSGTSILLIVFFDFSGAMLSRNVAYSGEKFKTATAPANTAYAIVSFYDWEQTAEQQCELGSTATAYEPYNGNEYTIQLGETVYGGTLDVVNGKMTVDRAYERFTNAARQQTQAIPRIAYGFYPSKVAKGSAGATNVLCNQAITDTSSETSSGDVTTKVTCRLPNYDGSVIWLFAPPSVFPDLETLNAYLADNPIEFVYLLRDSFTLTLTPEQISTLHGTNNVWSDAGDVTVEYRAR